LIEEEIKSNLKNAIKCGSITFGDKKIAVNMFAKKNELNNIQLIYIVFDHSKRK
jgi:hypothetical protein